MIRAKSTRWLAGVALSMLVASAMAQAPADPPPQGVPELRQEANRAYFQKDYPAFRDAMLRLHELRPNNSEYMYQLVLAYALLDDKRSAYNMMLQMQRQGLAYDFDQAEESENIRNTEIYDYVNDLMVRAGEPMGQAEPVLTLAEDVEFPEAITWDAARKALLIGTIKRGQVLAVGLDGSTTELLRADDSNGMWSVFDVLVDSANDRLWLSSASNRMFDGFDPVDEGRSALFEFELGSLELVRRYPVPVDGRRHQLGNMAMAPNGDIYAADSRWPIVYVKRADEDRLRPYYASKDLVSLRGLAVSEDGKSLYVADYEMGIVHVDIEASKPSLLTAPATLNLGGIDGLYFWNGHLVVIQNGIRPQRVMRLRLDESGRGVSEVGPLAVALETFDSPNYGTVIDDDLYFFANSHWASSGSDRQPVRIVRTDLAGGEDLMPPDMRKFMEERGLQKPPGPVAPQPGIPTDPQAPEAGSDSGG